VRLRVVVYNVRGFRDGVDAVSDVVGPCEPDVLLLQESDGRRTLRRFAKRAGLRPATDPPSPLRRRVKNAVLVRPPWRVVSRRLHRFERSARFYPRGALVAQLGRSGLRAWVVSVHFGLSPSERRRHAEELTDLAASLGGPVVIGGDLNSGDQERSVAWIADRYWDAWAQAGEGDGSTFPARDPSARIDYLFVSEPVRVASVAVMASPDARRASDHLPVVADLELEI